MPQEGPKGLGIIKDFDSVQALFRSATLPLQQADNFLDFHKKMIKQLEAQASNSTPEQLKDIADDKELLDGLESASIKLRRTMLDMAQYEHNPDKKQEFTDAKRIGVDLFKEFQRVFEKARVRLGREGSDLL